MRIDDTNPKSESEEFEKSIIEDVNNLNINYNKLTYSSNYFDELNKYVESLLNLGDAYIDLTDIDTMRDEREKAIQSKYRNNTIEENLKLWNEMKSDMHCKNKVMILLYIDLWINYIIALGQI